MSSDSVEVIAENRDARGAHRRLTVAAAQIGGPWLDKEARIRRVVEAAKEAKRHGADLIAYPETYVAGYPFWMSRTNGALFNDPGQKAAYARHLDAAIVVGGEEHLRLEMASRELDITLVVGVTERGRGVGSGTTWCTILTIDPNRGTVGHHRKLVPTYDERLVWAQGDGAGLLTHPVGSAVVGSLNCWENWMSPARSALAAQGEDVHIGIWPGSAALTGDITRFTALESRVFSIAVSGLISIDDVPDDFPLADQLTASDTPIGFDGGSAIAGPDGRWVIAPVVGAEGLLIADLDLDEVRAARLTFDPTGHYARPDVFHTTVNRSRRDILSFQDDVVADEQEAVTP